MGGLGVSNWPAKNSKDGSLLYITPRGFEYKFIRIIDQDEIDDSIS